MKFRALALGKSHLPAAVWTVTAILSLWGMASVARADGEPAADLASRVSRLAAEVEAAEDIRAIKHLQRAYGFYLDKGMWEDLSQLFTADAVANYPTGIYVGKDSIRRHLFLNVGAVKLGEVGLGDGRLYIHMNIQPVVHLDPGAQTAKGRWRALAMFGSYGGSATWAEGVYELSYRKEGGVWKIHTLDYYCGFGAPYQTGWVPPETPRTGSGGGRRPLAYPPDRERKMECDGFPAACIAPFHYGNPGRTAAAHAWTISDAQLSAQLDINRHANLRTVLADLSRRATRLEDEQTIENLQRIYGYYFDRAAWDQVADLFATNATVEIGLQGVYVGKQHLRRFLETLAPQGLSAGVLNDHIQLQTLVDIAPDGRT
ncbi:MAG TPA: nuclear transport factor 2 family protein, partial [Steroidobacteraceae bacterium]